MANRRVSVEVDADVSPFISGLTRAGLTAKTFARELESADSRMAALVQTGLALAPALVPLGAAAVPALAGLTTQLGFAVAAAGTTVLAFQGVGDALKSLNDYQIDPTAEHFKKLGESLDALGPAGQEFVFFLQDLRPNLQELQDIAQQGLLPGVEDGINELMDLLPEAADYIGTISSTLGSLFAEAGDNLNDQRWIDFFSYLDREAGPTLTAMGHTLGNLVEGLANMIVAFDPLADDFTSGFLRMSRSFKEWTAGLDSSEGFQNFVDYVRESGPQAMEALGAIANALVSLVEAAAPVGAVVLPVIEALADGLSAIASSPAGPILITAAAAIGTLGRSMALLKSVGLMGGDSVISRVLGTKALGDARTAATSLRTAQAELAQAAISARDAQFALIPTAGKRAALNQYADAQRKVAVAEQERSAALRQGMASVGKAAALVGGLAVASSGLAESTGLSNTASLALMGTLAGPWGAAMGAGVGLVMDMAAANNDAETAMRRAGSASRSMAIDLGTQAATLDDARAKTEAYYASIQSNAPVGALRSFADLFTHSSKELSAGLSQNTQDYMAIRQGVADFYAALNDGDLSMLHATDDELTKFATQIAPAIQAAGLDIQDVLTSRNGWDLAVAAVQDYNASMDSASGKSAAVGAALAELSSEMADSASQAEILKNSMDALFGTELNQAEATDAWIAGLKDLRKQIAETNGVITGNSKAALENREAIRSSVQDLQDRVAADAAAGVSGDKLVTTLLNGRDAIVDQAAAAGANRDKVKAYVDDLGLMPKNLKTIIETPGLLDAQQKVQALGRLYGLTPKEVSTLVSQPGMARSKADIEALAEKYKITPKQVRTLITANTAEAIAAINQVQTRLAAMKDKTIRVFVAQTFATSGRKMGEVVGADGMTLDFYANGGTRENHVAQIAPAGAWRVWAEEETGGEAYIPLAPSKRERSLDIWREVGARMGVQFAEFASGGVNAKDVLTAKEFNRLKRDLQVSFDMDTSQVRDELRDFAKGIRTAGGHVGAGFDDLKARLIASSKELDVQREALEDSKDALTSMRAAAVSMAESVSSMFQRDIFGSDAGQGAEAPKVDAAAYLPANFNDLSARDQKSAQLDAAAKADAEQAKRNATFAAINADFDQVRRRNMLTSDISDARAFQAALKVVDRKDGKGTSEFFKGLAASGNTQQAEIFAGMSRRDLAQEVQLYAQRIQVANRTGGFASNAATREDIKELIAETRELRKDFRAAAGDRGGILSDAKIQRLATATGNAVGAKINHAAAGAGRKRANG